MVSATQPADEVARLAQEHYKRGIGARVERDHQGDYLVINIETGEFEVGPDDLEVSLRARERFPDAVLFTMRVGQRAAYRLGGRMTAQFT